MNSEDKILLMSYVDGELDAQKNLEAETLIAENHSAMNFVNQLKIANNSIEASYQGENFNELNSRIDAFIKENFKEEKKSKVPAVVHKDGTARIQTVTKKDNEWYYTFLKKWEAESGVPMILNTSFNDREPICETPQHAINCFLGTDIDFLYFYDYNILLSKAKIERG